MLRIYKQLTYRLRSVSLALLFITTPQGKLPKRSSPMEAWFGLKAYAASDIIFVRVLGWMAVVSLLLALLLASCLAVLRLSTLWDYWFEEIRRSDRESGFHRFLRIFSFWLAVLGFSAWIACGVIS